MGPVCMYTPQLSTFNQNNKIKHFVVGGYSYTLILSLETEGESRT